MLSLANIDNKFFHKIYTCKLESTDTFGLAVQYLNIVHYLILMLAFFLVNQDSNFAKQILQFGWPMGKLLNMLTW